VAHRHQHPGGIFLKNTSHFRRFSRRSGAEQQGQQECRAAPQNSFRLF
jgi:hypothetical protein